MRSLLLASALIAATGCVVPSYDASGHKCDPSRLCPEGWLCRAGVCEEPRACGASEASQALLAGGTDEGGVSVGAQGVERVALEGGLGAWAQAGQAPELGAGLAWAVHAGRLYLLGGRIGGQPESTVAFAAIRPGGLDAWTWATPLLSPREGHAAVAAGGYLYVAGGRDASGRMAEVQVAALRCDGSLGPWAAVTPLPHPLADQALVARAGRLYALGGEAEGPAASAEVWVAEQQGDGTLGAWTAARGLPVAVSGLRAVASGGFLYVTGGQTTGAAATAGTYYAAVLSDGSLGDWASAAPLPSPRHRHAALVSGGFLYALGGLGPMGALAEVAMAPLRASGEPGAWTPTTSLRAGAWGFAAAAASGTLVAVGGEGLGATAWAAPIDGSAVGEDGLGAWQTAAALPRASEGASAAAEGETLYVLGGCATSTAPCTSPLDQVVAARAEPGSPISWTPQSPLPQARRQLSSVAHRGTLVALGGTGLAGDTDRVDLARILADGSLGAWSPGPALPSPIHGAGAAAARGFLYVAGGASGTSVKGEVVYGQLGADGSLGPWLAGPGISPRVELGLIAYGGTLFAVGGSNGSARTEVQISALQPDGKPGPWSSTTPLPEARTRAAVFARGGRLFAAGGFNGTAELKTVVSAPILASGQLGTWRTEPSLPTVVSGAAMASTGGRLVVLGGSGPRAEVLVAPLLTQLPIGHFGTMIPLGESGAVPQSLRLDVEGAGRLRLSYRAAPERELGPLRALGELFAPEVSLAEEAPTRFLWLDVTIDDSELPRSAWASTGTALRGVSLQTAGPEGGMSSSCGQLGGPLGLAALPLLLALRLRRRAR